MKPSDFESVRTKILRKNIDLHIENRCMHAILKAYALYRREVPANWQAQLDEMKESAQCQSLRASCEAILQKADQEDLETLLTQISAKASGTTFLH